MENQSQSTAMELYLPQTRIDMYKNGFTLIEMLIVLSMLSILILLAVPQQISILSKQKEEQFIEQLEFDVLLIQNQSNLLLKDSNMYIRFYDNYYSVLGGWSDSTIANRPYPDGWILIINEQHRTLKFSETGTVINPRTLVMYSKNERISIVFPLGKGRFHVAREKRFLSH